MRYGITAYRLPRDVLGAEIDVLVRTGIDIRVGSRLGRDFDLPALARDGFRATLLAVGALGLGLLQRPTLRMDAMRDRAIRSKVSDERRHAGGGG